MSLKNFRYLNMTHRGRDYAAKGCDKPSELHSIFNAMVASTRKTRKQQPKQPEKKMGGYKGKTPAEHLADAKAMTLFGIKVLDEMPYKEGKCWQILIECERCGSKKWISKNDLTRTKSCGCLKPRSAKPKAPFDLADPVEIVEETVENEKKIALPKEDFKAFEENFVKVNSSQCDSNCEKNEKNEKKADRVCVSRRLVVGLARECGNQLHDFWNLEPAAFEVAIRDAREIYEALK